LLADDDPAGAVARVYNVYDERDRICERALYVLDGSGIVRWSYVSPRAENPGAHGILNALESIVSESTNEQPKAS
jgi:alkyl hydroperoxide reductase subunit AhpC